MSWSITVDPIFGCWLWDGSVNSSGYPLTRDDDGKRVYAHHAAWEEEHGKKLAAGVALDHGCRRTRCIRPCHLEPVTQAENTRRISRRYRELHVTSCPEGHPFDRYGLATPEQGKVCSRCIAEIT